jgi:hypothetical protein
MKLLASSVVLAAGVLVGFCGAWSLLQAPRASAHSSTPVLSSAAGACVARLDAAQLALLRREVTAALRAAQDGASSGDRTDAATESAASAPPPIEDLPSEDSLAAADDAQRRVRAAIARQRWSPEDRGALRELMPRLTQQQTEGLLRELVLAINAGELRQDAPGPLL